MDTIGQSDNLDPNKADGAAIALEMITLQRRALELALADAPLKSVLEIMTRTVELQAGTDLIASVLLSNREETLLFHGAAPRLPDEYNKIVDGIPIAANVGSCGSAGFSKEIVIVTDIANDVRWADYKDIAGKFGLAACWSVPILSSTNQLLGTFAFYSKVPRVPLPQEIQIVAVAATTTALIIERSREIVDRKAAAAQAELAAKQVTDILENTNDGFFAVDRNFTITRVNTNHEKFTQKKREDQIGQNLFDLFFSAPEFKESMYFKGYHKAMNERVPVVFEDYYAPADLWTAVSVYPQPDGGLAIFFRKTNDEKKVQKSLIEAKEEAERANELKSAFLANMSHEIRTPLGAMLGFADLLREPGLTATERASYIDILSRNGESLAVIINDILDLSKVESGHLTVEYTDTFPDQIGADVVSLFRVQAKEKDLILEYSHDESSPEKVTSDPMRVRQILINLVGNAIKFTQSGSVKIRAFGSHTDDGRPCICFEVKDSGIGIAESQLEHIFEMFVQADGTMTRRFGGTGLGLALSRKLARALGGDVTITESREGFGTTFLVRIQDQPSRYDASLISKRSVNPSTYDFKEGALKDVRVLVVDDAPDNQQLIWRYLTKQGAQVESAENGLLGYRAALTGAFDIILMDIQMPVMDGYTATAKLRETGYRKPIIALTAHAMSDVRKEALNVGYTDHLPKPIAPKELIATILKYTKPASGGPL